MRRNQRNAGAGFGEGTPQQDRGCVATKAPVGLSSGSTVCVANGGVSLRQVLDHVDSNFSSIENLWPQVDTCFRLFRATLKFSRIEPQCTLKILQSKMYEKAKPLLMVAVHTERSSCPCFAAALSGSLTGGVRSWRGITFGRLMKDSRCSMKKAGRSADTTTCFFQASE